MGGLILISALGGGDLFNSHPSPFTPLNNAGAHGVGGRVVATAYLDVSGNRKYLTTARFRTPDCPARSLVTIPTNLAVFPVVKTE
jgi:hypothetical protein